MALSGNDRKTINKKEEVGDIPLTIQVPRFDNTDLIRGYAKMVIGRCMNPQRQDLKALLYMLPRIWKVEERVSGMELGCGRFRYDFEDEKEMEAILKLAPFHFDQWMLALVKWHPGMERDEPYNILFWVRVVDLQLEWWVESTFQSIGEGLGVVQEGGVDILQGRVRVLIDERKPLVFDTIVNFHTGVSTRVSLEYEKLFSFCKRCWKMCHEWDSYPLMKEEHKGKGRVMIEERRPRGGSMVKYKGAVANGYQGQPPKFNDHGVRRGGRMRGMGSRSMQYRAREPYQPRSLRSSLAEKEGRKETAERTGGKEGRVAGAETPINKTSEKDETCPPTLQANSQESDGPRMEHRGQKEEMINANQTAVQASAELVLADIETTEGVGATSLTLPIDTDNGEKEVNMEDNDVRGNVKEAEGETDLLAETEEEEIDLMATVEIDEHAQDWDHEDDMDLLLLEEQEQEQKFQEGRGGELFTQSRGEGSVVETGEGKRQGAQKNLFPQQKVVMGRTTTQRILQKLASPRKGGVGMNKGKEKKEGGKNLEMRHLGLGKGIVKNLKINDDA